MRAILTTDTATALSWGHPYKGYAHKALWGHIETYATSKDYCAPYRSIVQSSGTGKSRCIDELGKDHLVVPMSLRCPETRGEYMSHMSIFTIIHRLITRAVQAFLLPTHRSIGFS